MYTIMCTSGKMWRVFSFIVLIYYDRDEIKTKFFSFVYLLFCFDLNQAWRNRGGKRIILEQNILLTFEANRLYVFSVSAVEHLFLFIML